LTAAFCGKKQKKSASLAFFLHFLSFLCLQVEARIRKIGGLTLWALAIVSRGWYFCRLEPAEQ